MRELVKTLKLNYDLTFKLVPDPNAKEPWIETALAQPLLIALAEGETTFRISLARRDLA